MARKSIIAREDKRAKLIAKYAVKRAALKAIIHDPKTNAEEQWDAQMKLQRLPKNSAPARARNRCRITGRPRGVYKQFGMCRNMLRKMTMSGQVPGLRKASW